MSEGQVHIEESIIISYLSGDELPKETRREIEKWLENEKNQEEARRVFHLWELSLITSPKVHDAEVAYEKLSDHLFPKEIEGEISKSVSFRYPKKWLVAAFIALLMVSFGWWLWPKEEALIALEAVSEKRDFTLEDRSEVSLNEGSELVYLKSNFTEGTSENREVWLNGEGFFEVENNQENSFVVHTKDADITVLGTKFLVKELSGLPTKVLVAEGKVEVYYRQFDQRLILEAEEEIAVSKAVDTVQITSSDNNQLYWKTGIMTFERKSLGYVFETLSKEFDVEIVAENEEVFSCELTATFKKQSLETIMEVIKTTHGLESHFLQDTIIMEGDGCQ